MSKEEVGREGYFFENEQVWELENLKHSRTTEEEVDKKMESRLPASYTEEASEKGKETIKLVGKKRSRECSNSVKRTKRSKSVNNEKNDEARKSASDHDSHILTERERRKKMKNMFATLHSLLPNLSHKADKSTIVDEAINYISKLQNTFQKLQKQKSERLNSHCMNTGNRYLIQRNCIGGSSRETFLADHGSSSNSLAMSVSSAFSVPRFPVNFRSFTSQNVALSVCGDVAHISICSRKKPGLVTAISYVLEKYQLEVVSAHVSSDHITSMLMIQVHANGAQNQFPEGFQVEEIFKQAAAEMMLWVTS